MLTVVENCVIVLKKSRRTKEGKRAMLKGKKIAIIGGGKMGEVLAHIIDMALTIYMWIIILRAVISWVNPDPYNRIVIFLYRVTEPVLRPIRRWIPLGHLGIDISPIIVILIIYFLQIFLVQTLIQTAYHFQS